MQEFLFWDDIFYSLNGSKYVFLDNFFYLVSYKWIWLFFYFCFLAVLVHRKNWKESVCVILSITLVICLCDQISSSIMKPLFQQLRPTHHPDFMAQVKIVMGYRGGLYGFVSGHAANTFGFATLMILIFRNKIFSVMIIFFAVVNAYSRVYLGVHFIRDVFAGMIVGVLIGLLVYKIYIFVRYKWIKIEKDELKKPVCSKRKSYFLCMVFCFCLVVLFTFNSQLINILFGER
ncbi:MAG: phosphatase PAP2 family protein [Prevotellaceae bacterium]|nr:phosphatase PAP2 family protein [Prevotellaceae bacterium]